MTFNPTAACFGNGQPITSISDSTVANEGASNFPASPNSDGESSTRSYLTKLNVLNIGTSVPSNAQTT